MYHYLDKKVYNIVNADKFLIAIDSTSLKNTVVFQDPSLFTPKCELVPSEFNFNFEAEEFISSYYITKCEISCSRIVIIGQDDSFTHHLYLKYNQPALKCQKGFPSLEYTRFNHTCKLGDFDKGKYIIVSSTSPGNFIITVIKHVIAKPKNEYREVFA